MWTLYLAFCCYNAAAMRLCGSIDSETAELSLVMNTLYPLLSVLTGSPEKWMAGWIPAPRGWTIWVGFVRSWQCLNGNLKQVFLEYRRACNK